MLSSTARQCLDNVQLAVQRKIPNNSLATCLDDVHDNAANTYCNRARQSRFVLTVSRVSIAKRQIQAAT
jgi:hypothetical protein